MRHVGCIMLLRSCIILHRLGGQRLRGRAQMAVILASRPDYPTSPTCINSAEQLSRLARHGEQGERDTQANKLLSCLYLPGCRISLKCSTKSGAKQNPNSASLVPELGLIRH